MSTSNHFDPSLPDEMVLRQLIEDEANAASVDADIRSIVDELSRWCGWYRLETSPPYNATIREQHAEADKLHDTLATLAAQLHGMSPDLKAHFHDKLHTLSIASSAYELSRFAQRLQACAKAAGKDLGPAKTGKQSNTNARNNAIRGVAESILKFAPGMRLGVADSLAARLVGQALGIRVPEDARELRKIVRG